MFGPLARHFWRRHAHAIHGPHAPHGLHGPHGGHAPRGGHHHHRHLHEPTREELIAHLEEYQRDLEEETIAVATRIKELRAARAADEPAPPRTQPGHREGDRAAPPPDGSSGTPFL